MQPTGTTCYLVPVSIRGMFGRKHLLAVVLTRTNSAFGPLTHPAMYPRGQHHPKYTLNMNILQRIINWLCRSRIECIEAAHKENLYKIYDKLTNIARQRDWSEIDRMLELIRDMIENGD